MALIEVNQNRKVLISVRLDEDIVVQVNQYAAFIQAPPDEVINKGLQYLFSKDREFIAFRNSAQSQHVPELLRPRKAASPNGSKPPARATEVPASVASGKA